MQELAGALWAMAKTGGNVPDVFEALCAKAAEKPKDFNALGLGTTLRTMAETGAGVPWPKSMPEKEPAWHR